MKKKDQILFNEEVARKLQKEIYKKERLVEERARQGKEANNALIETWEDIQAKVDDDYQLEERLQAREQEQLIDAEKAKLFIEFMEKRIKFFAAQRTTKKGTNHLPKLNKGTPMIDYKIYKEMKKNYFLIFRADVNSQMYLTFSKLLKNFNREDLEVLWRLVKDRVVKTKPVDDIDSFLMHTLKTKFEHHVENNEAQALSQHARVKDPSPMQTSSEVTNPRVSLALVETQSQRPGNEPMQLDDMEERRQLDKGKKLPKSCVKEKIVVNDNYLEQLVTIGGGWKASAISLMGCQSDDSQEGATEEAFLEMKKLVSELPTLTTLKKGETLMMYLVAANEAVSVVGMCLITHTIFQEKRT
uniref:Reverse transcriptase domain-containing protein n=1 Tax=Tanacetum cinerariifolium TaxID=118510 RepID=A0A6L2J5U7_TANCI|nr:hypothetical protein [Tanacetum cinerariifolium]